MFYYIRFIYFLFCTFFYFVYFVILYCFCVVLCIICPFVLSLSFFLHKSTDRCHRVETKL